jgi:hypothetical protein
VDTRFIHSVRSQLAIRGKHSDHRAAVEALGTVDIIRNYFIIWALKTSGSISAMVQGNSKYCPVRAPANPFNRSSIATTVAALRPSGHDLNPR